MSPSAPPSKPKPKFGEPEKPDPRLTVLKWSFVVLVVGAIIWMIASNPKQRELVCHTGGGTSLTGFGTCEEQ